MTIYKKAMERLNKSVYLGSNDFVWEVYHDHFDVTATEMLKDMPDDPAPADLEDFRVAMVEENHADACIPYYSERYEYLRKCPEGIDDILANEVDWDQYAIDPTTPSLNCLVGLAFDSVIWSLTSELIHFIELELGNNGE